MSQPQLISGSLLEFPSELSTSPARLAELEQLLDPPELSALPLVSAAAYDELGDLRQRVDQLEKALAQSADDLRATRSEVGTLVSLAGDFRKATPRQRAVIPFPAAPTTPRVTRMASAVAGIVLGVSIGIWFWKGTPSKPLLPSVPVAIASELSVAPPASPARAIVSPIVPPATPRSAAAAIIPAAVAPAVRDQPERAAPSRGEYVGTLTIDSDPGGDVFIDRKPAGRTPLRAERLRAGSHLIWIEQDGYQRFTRVVQVPADRITRLVADLERATR